MRENHERFDEKMAREVLVRWCNSNGIELTRMDHSQQIKIEGTTPDCIFYFESNGIEENAVVEITLGSDFIEGKKRTINRYENAKNVISMSNDLKQLISCWADPTQTIILTIDFPVEALNRKEQKKLSEQLKHIFLGNIDTENVDIELNGRRCSARSTSSYQNQNYASLLFSYGPSLCSTNPGLENNLHIQAKYMLHEAISKKEKIYGHVNLEKWLLIINTSPLLDYNIFQSAYNELKAQTEVVHTFKKVFVVIGIEAFLLL